MSRLGFPAQLARGSAFSPRVGPVYQDPVAGHDFTLTTRFVPGLQNLGREIQERRSEADGLRFGQRMTPVSCSPVGQHPRSQVVAVHTSPGLGCDSMLFGGVPSERVYAGRGPRWVKPGETTTAGASRAPVSSTRATWRFLGELSSPSRVSPCDGCVRNLPTELSGPS